MHEPLQGLARAMREGASGEGVIDGAWDIWSPNGGFLAVLAYSAMAAQSRFERPVSFHAQFLRPARHGAYSIAVERMRAGSTTDTLRATLRQGDDPVVHAMLTLTSGGAGFEHHSYGTPGAPPPSVLAPYDVLAQDYASWWPYWRQVEGRPCVWPELHGDAPAEWRTWLRLRSAPEPPPRHWTAARVLLWCDIAPFNAATAAHEPPFGWIAPNIDLYVQFHDLDGVHEWLLAEAVSPVGKDGVVAGSSRIWTEDGRLVASSGLQMICRPVAVAPPPAASPSVEHA